MKLKKSLINANVVSSLGVSITIDANTGNFTYVPPAGYEGVDTFQYQIQDGSGLTSTATVTLNIAFKNKPIAVADDYITQKILNLLRTAALEKRRYLLMITHPTGKRMLTRVTLRIKQRQRAGRCKFKQTDCLLIRRPQTLREMIRLLIRLIT